MRRCAHSPGLGCLSLKNSSHAAAGLILLWVVLFLSQLRWCHSMDANQHNHLTDQQQHLKSGHDQLSMMFAPRELLGVAQQKISGSSNAVAVAASSLSSQPPIQIQFMIAEDGNGSEVVYEDDKRRVHTGPNPLHN